MTHGSPSTQDLTDTQLVLLSQASQRADGKVMPPAHLKGGIFRRVMASLVGKGLVQTNAAPEANVTGQQDDDPAGTCPVISPAGLAALGITDNAIPGFPDGIGTTPVDIGLESMRAPRTGSKQAMVLELLTHPDGATLDMVMTGTGWLPHTARAVLSGLRKRGYGIERINGGDGGSRYRLIAPGLPQSPGPLPAPAGTVTLATSPANPAV